MQSLPNRARTDVALRLLGCNPIITDIDYKSLFFFFFFFGGGGGGRGGYALYLYPVLQKNFSHTD